MSHYFTNRDYALEEGRHGLIGRTWESVRAQNSLKRKHPGEIRGARQIANKVAKFIGGSAAATAAVVAQSLISSYFRDTTNDYTGRKRNRSNRPDNSRNKRRKFVQTFIEIVLPTGRHKRWLGGTRKIIGVNAQVRGRVRSRKSIVSDTVRRKRLRRLLNGWLGRSGRSNRKSARSGRRSNIGRPRFNLRRLRTK